MSDATNPGTEVFATFVKDELEAQEQRKASFGQRGVAVITTAGALVTLLFGLATLSTRAASTFRLPPSAQEWLTASLVLLGVAALFALLTNVPLNYKAVDVEPLKAAVKAAGAADEAHKDVALTRLKALSDAKRKNGWKGSLLLAALASEAAAAACVAVAVGHIL